MFPAEGNIMSNDLVSTTAGTVVLYSSMLVYLALGMTTTQYALRQSLDSVLVGEDAGFTWRRHVSLWDACDEFSHACLGTGPLHALLAREYADAALQLALQVPYEAAST
jgi:hypothetical protein